MEEDKIQRLHDSLSKLRKGKGLGTNSHFSWNAHASVPLKKDEDGNMYREDGLPVNGLYANFVPQGTYDPTKMKENSTLKYGDGRVIKRNFDDIEPISSSEGNGEDKSKKKKSKEERKAEKKAAKLEAKRQAKLEEKRRLKLEAKKAAMNIEKVNTAEEEGKASSIQPEKEGKEKSKKKKSKKKKSENSKDDDANSSELPKKSKRKREDNASRGKEKKSKKKKSKS